MEDLAVVAMTMTPLLHTIHNLQGLRSRLGHQHPAREQAQLAVGNRVRRGGLVCGPAQPLEPLRVISQGEVHAHSLIHHHQLGQHSEADGSDEVATMAIPRRRGNHRPREQQALPAQATQPHGTRAQDLEGQAGDNGQSSGSAALSRYEALTEIGPGDSTPVHLPLMSNSPLIVKAFNQLESSSCDASDAKPRELKLKSIRHQPSSFSNSSS